jgi:hypothetical protein
MNIYYLLVHVLMLFLYSCMFVVILTQAVGGHFATTRWVSLCLSLSLSLSLSLVTLSYHSLVGLTIRPRRVAHFLCLYKLISDLTTNKITRV